MGLEMIQRLGKKKNNEVLNQDTFLSFKENEKRTYLRKQGQKNLKFIER